jgi:hypothetical protein
VSLPLTKEALEDVTVVIAIDALPVQIVIAETALIQIFVCKCEDTNAMLHPTAPISLVFCSREEVVPAVAIDLIIDEAT